jgi:hypothetical protein
MQKTGRLAVVTLWIGLFSIGSRAYAEPVTMATFLFRLYESNTTTRMHGDIEPFDCEAREGRKVCHGNVKFGQFGIRIITQSGIASDELTFADLVMASPQVAPDDNQKKSMIGAFAFMAAQIAATFSPEVSQDTRANLVKKMIAAINNGRDEAMLGKWVYRWDNGVIVTFSVGRADERS